MPSVKTNFSLKAEDIAKINNAILNFGTGSEEVINDYLHNEAAETITKSITNYIPRSPRKNVIHAKNSKWSEQTDYNLAVNISNSLRGKRGTSFYYLYYVVTGTGTNKKKGSRDFMSQGLNQEYSNVVKGIIDKLNKNIEKEIKV